MSSAAFRTRSPPVLILDWASIAPAGVWMLTPPVPLLSRAPVSSTLLLVEPRLTGPGVLKLPMLTALSAASVTVLVAVAAAILIWLPAVTSNWPAEVVLPSTLTEPVVAVRVISPPACDCRLPRFPLPSLYTVRSSLSVSRVMLAADSNGW